MEMPEAHLPGFAPDVAQAKALIAQALAEGRTELFEHEAKALLVAYGIPTVATEVVLDAQAAVKAADAIGYPVAVKVISRQISHKSDVGGVQLSLADGAAVMQAVEKIVQNVKEQRPEAVIEGFSVQAMVMRPRAYELIVGVSTDRQFGPVLMLGEGGVAVEVINDKALELPPINERLARQMLASTRVWKRLKGFRDRKPVDSASVVNVLLKISQLVADIGAISELDINPLLVDEAGVIALDARVKIAAVEGGGRLAIHAYPEYLEGEVALTDGTTARVRPVKPSDAEAIAALVSQLGAHDVFQRFEGEFPALGVTQSARLSHVDYEREIVFVITGDSTPYSQQGADMLGCVFCSVFPALAKAEFTLAVHQAYAGRGIATALTRILLHYLSSRAEIERLEGVSHAKNASVIALLEALDFRMEALPGGERVVFVKKLR
ncbi:MAG: GNAT family N-acetyltransferase, partial [Rickettsiales bacterium]|nr:GNAT family N-acetyltransferase [Rickettsiales bacterium]